MKAEQTRSPLTEILEEFQQIQASLRILPTSQKAIILVGENKAGKTAFFHYLQGNRLVHEKNQMGVYVLRPEDPNDPAKVGSDYTFTTLAPNYSFKLPEKTMEIDMPGYSNNQPKYQLLKIYVFYKVIEHIEEAHICQLLSEQQLQPFHLLKEAQKMSKFFKPQVINTEGYLSFVITKVEDEDAIANFEAVIEELKEQNEAAHVRSQLEHILSKKKYLFKNQQPNPDEGVQLSKTIHDESKFLKMSRQPKSLLSDTFFQVVIGQSQIGQLLSYVESILPSLIDLVNIMVHLSIKSLFYEYSSIVSHLSGVQEEQLKEKLVLDIIGVKQKVGMDKIKSISFRKEEENSLDKYHYQIMETIFRRSQGSPEKHQVTNFLKSLTKIFDVGTYGQNQTWARLSHEWVAYLNSTISVLLSLLFTLSLIQVEPIRGIVDKIEQNKACTEEIEYFYLMWEQNRQKLNTHMEYLKAIGGQSSQTQSLVVKKPCFKQIKNNNISDLIRKAKIATATLPLQTEKIPQSYQLTEQSIQALKNTSSSFQFLIHCLGALKQEAVVRIIIKKISAIFHRFSLFQEAIVFMMALNQWQSIQCLVQEGFLYKEISSQFVFEILSKYYRHFGRRERRVRQLQLCSNYISSLANPELLIRFQKTCLRQIDVLKSNIASSFQMHEKYQTVQLHYIHPIISLADYYIELLKSKESLFQRSICHKLVKAPIIQQLFL